ncbi:MAG: YihY family inner membrane protein [Gammaproteobacteria bacterium]|nr:YihY family inner membrane protein [Gammaproteobacteria bacterium]
MSQLREKFDDLIWGDGIEKHGKSGHLAAIVLRYAYGLIRDMVSGQITLRAMSLVYTTLLSVVPLIAFSFSVLQGFGMHNKLQPFLYDFLEPLGDQGALMTTQIIELVDNVKGGVLGGISLAFFIYTAITMVQKMEESFNYVWYVVKVRSFARRLTEYMIVLLIGPVIIVIALGMIASLRSNTLVQFILTSDALGPIVIATSKLTPYLLVTGVFTFLYVYMPNTKVRFKAALIGGLVGGFIWASLSAIFAAVVVFSTSKQVIYAGFAVAIFALIWLYLNWLVLLFGAQLAYYVQNPEFLRIGRREPRLSNAMSERLALNIMLLVGRTFRDPGRTVSAADISAQMQMPSITMSPVLTALEEAGLLVATENEDLLPGKDMATIRLDDILAIVREHGETGSYRDPRWSEEIEKFGKHLDEAFLATVGEQTLIDLLGPVDHG